MNRSATIVISDWLANCRAGQWTPFEAATALKATLTKEGYAIVPNGELNRLRAENERLKAAQSEILSVVNCDFNSRRNLG